MTPLRQQMIDAMTVRRLAKRTQQAYLSAVTGLSRYYRCSPDKISNEQIQAYLLHLINERQYAWSSVNQVSNGLRYFHRNVLKHDDVHWTFPPAKRPQKQPQILSIEEVKRIVNTIDNPQQRCMIMTIYGAGLRVNEAVNLRNDDVDAERMTLFIRNGKGSKDRHVTLSGKLLTSIRSYQSQCGVNEWLFPNTTRTKPVSVQWIQRAYARAKRAAGVHKSGGIHGLRHAYATHLLEAGTDVQILQQLMGHRSLRSTVRYVHLSRRKVNEHGAALELLDTVAS